jgi:hypothetical protein
VAVGPEVGVVGLWEKKKTGMGWAAGLEKRMEMVWFCFFLSFLFQPFTYKILSSFQKLF